MSIAMRTCAAVAALSLHWCAAAKPLIPIEWKASGVVTTIGSPSSGGLLADAQPGDRLHFHARFDAVDFWSESAPAGPGAAEEAMTYRLTREAPVATVSITRGDVIIATYAASVMTATVRDEFTGIGAGQDSVEFRISIHPHSLPESFVESGGSLELFITASGDETLLGSTDFPLSLKLDDYASVEFSFLETDGESGESALIAAGDIEEWSWAVVPGPGTLWLAMVAIPLAMRRRR